MVARARSVAVVGLEAVPVTVEAHIGQGLPGFQLIGSSGTAGREAADRVRAALTAVGARLPQRKILVSLAPAEVPKAGARFDLALAAAVLAELELVPRAALGRAVLLGELALDGAVRGVPGVLPAAASLAGGGDRLMVADANASEAALVEGLDVVGVSGLSETSGVLGGRCRPRPVTPAVADDVAPKGDLADVRGQAEARRALEIAAAGGHHLLLLGPPGCGKSMLARRLSGLLPALSDPEALELAAVRSVAGFVGTTLDRCPPFRAPHHTVSRSALLGGGSGVARPGELSLAHRGALFLDEVFEWSRATLDALREPLEEGVVRLARSRASVVYPARVQLVAAGNPCPCGGGEGCECPDEAVWRYRARLSGPLADRLDLAPTVSPVSARDLLTGEPGEPSAGVRARVARARALAADRWRSGGRGTPGPALGATNAEAGTEALRRVTRQAALVELANAVEAGRLTGRGYDRTLRVARTCADLAGADLVEREHVLEAYAHRLALEAAPVSAGTRR